MTTDYLTNAEHATMPSRGTGKFEYWKARKVWRFHYKAANGKIVAPSQGYSRRIDCMNAIQLLRGVTLSTPVVERKG